MERMTKANLETRCANLNRRMESRGSMYRYEIGYRYGYTAIDRYSLTDLYPDGALHDTVRTGMTKNEAGEFLHAMMVALDDASYKRDEVKA